LIAESCSPIGVDAFVDVTSGGKRRKEKKNECDREVFYHVLFLSCPISREGRRDADQFCEASSIYTGCVTRAIISVAKHLQYSDVVRIDATTLSGLEAYRFRHDRQPGKIALYLSIGFGDPRPFLLP
jgi:hypothetical protein